MNRLWPLCYGKSSMPQNKLIGKECWLGVLTEHQLEWEIDWAAYAVETNAMQRAKHARTLARYGGMRDRLLDEAGLGGVSKILPGGTSPGRYRDGEDMRFSNPVGQNLSARSFCPKWIGRLTLHVGDLLHLANLEMAACKVVAVQALAARIAVIK